MGRKGSMTKAKATTLVAAEQQLAERIATHQAEFEAAFAELARLEAEKAAALRDGTEGRQRARELIPAVLAQRELVALLEDERGVLADQEVELRVRREVEQIMRGLSRLAKPAAVLRQGAEAIDRALLGPDPSLPLADAMKQYAVARDRWTAALQPWIEGTEFAAALNRQNMQPWWAQVEALAASVAQQFNPHQIPSAIAARIADRTDEPAALVDAIRRAIVSHEWLAARYPDDRLRVAVVRALEEAGLRPAQPSTPSTSAASAAPAEPAPAEPAADQPPAAAPADSDELYDPDGGEGVDVDDE